LLSKATDNKVGVYKASAVMKELWEKDIKADFSCFLVGEETTKRGL
jgi:putative aminopeptidase FrvX